MAVNVAINGFGRIGRLVFRALVEQGLVGKEINVVAVGDIVPADNLAYLLKYDSTQGRFAGTVSSKKSTAEKAEDDVLIVNGYEIKVVSAKTPAELPWQALGVDIVIESTGLFTEAEKAKGHLVAGAKRSLFRHRPKVRTSLLSWESTMTNTTQPRTTSSRMPVAPRTVWLRLFTSCSKRALE